MSDIQSDVPAILDRIIAADISFDGWKFRATQADLMRRDANHNVMRWSHSANAPLMVQEAGTGIGKTLGELFVGGLFAQEGYRTVIAINTIALRQQIQGEALKMQAALKTGYAALGLRAPKQVLVRELESLSQYFSPMKIDLVNNAVKHATNLSDAERGAWARFFYDFFRRSYGSGDPIDIHSWYRYADGNPLPLGLSPLNLCLDETSDRELVATIVERRRQAFQADILIVTQTMLRLLAWRLRYLDWRTHQDKKISNDCGAYEFLKVDEAHSLTQITRSWIEQIIRFDTIRSLLHECPVNAERASNLADELFSYVAGRLGGENTVHAENPDEYHPLADRLTELYRELSKVLDAADEYPIFEAKMEMLLAALAPIVALRQNKNGMLDASFSDWSATDAYPIMFRRGRDYGITFKPGHLGRSMISSLWRRNSELSNQRMFRSVTMLSGTLTDAKPVPGDPYHYFRNQIGAMSGAGPDQEVIWYGEPIKTVNVGHATKVVYAERSSDLIPTIADDPNPIHTAYLARMIAYIHDHPDRSLRSNRVLALFMSERALVSTVEALNAMRPDVSEHVIAQRSGMRFFGKPLTDFQCNPRAVLLSMNWEGINAVSKDQDRKSLVGHLIISKAPFMPVDERRQRDTNIFVETRIRHHEAIWRFRQGLGRAMREPSARFIVWIGDPRIPLPDEMSPPLPKYVKQPSAFMAQLYDQFDDHCSLQLFGQSGRGRTGLFNPPVTLGYLYRQDDELALKELEVMLAPRPGDY